MVDLEIPAGPEAITPDWLTQALHSTGTITNAAVTSFDLESIGEQGIIGQVTRFRLDYDIIEENVPKSLVAKFANTDPEIQAIAKRSRMHEKEVRFYNEIAKEIELHTPLSYYGDFDIETGESVLLLEDINNARMGDYFQGCSFEEAEIVTRHLAKFHATFWQNPGLEKMEWMPLFNDKAKNSQDWYQRSWVRFTENFSDQLTGSFLELGERFGKHLVNHLNQLAEPPRTIIHSDLNIKNLFFGIDESSAPLTVIDWHFVKQGRGVFDVANFFFLCLTTEHWRAWELDLLRSYCSILVENGVQGYEFSQCLEDYRHSILYLLAYLPGGVEIEGNTSKSRESIRRYLTAVDDHKVSELLPE